MSQQGQVVAFLGSPGSFSDLAARGMFPAAITQPQTTFEDVLAAVRNGAAGLAVIPVDNTIAGRVADVHHLLPESGLFIVGEWFQPIRLGLFGVPGTDLGQIREVYSHAHALAQCRKKITEFKWTSHARGDTATALNDVAAWGDATKAAIGSALAGKICGLACLIDDMQDAAHNTTRFLAVAREPRWPEIGQDVLTSLVFTVRNIPAALYKALGGFATNGVQMMKLESYVGEGFKIARFYADIDGHPDQPEVARALDELRFFASDVKILGVYPAHAFRER